MMNRKVLLIIPTYLPIIGGAELAVHNIAIELNKNNIKADILTLNIVKKRWRTSLKTEVEMVNGITIYRLGSINLLFFLKHKGKSLLMRYLGFQMLPSLKLYNIAKKYDILHMNDEVNLSIPFFLIPLRKKKIFHLRTFGQLFPYFSKSLSKLTLNYVSNIFITETSNYIIMLEKLGINKNRCVLWNKGVNTDIFKRSYDKKIKNTGTINLLTIGRFNDKNKGFHIIVEALEYIEKKIKLTIITPDYDKNEYSSFLESKIESANKKNNIEIRVLKNIKQSDMVFFYNDNDLFVFVPLIDSMPNVLLEASACELPIIATNVGGIPKIIKDKETGILIEPNNSKLLVNEIMSLIDKKEYMRQLGKAARDYILINFSMKKSIEDLISIYNNL